MERQFVAVVLEEADNGRRTVPVISSTTKNTKNAGADTVTRPSALLAVIKQQINVDDVLSSLNARALPHCDDL